MDIRKGFLVLTVALVAVLLVTRGFDLDANVQRNTGFNIIAPRTDVIGFTCHTNRLATAPHRKS